MPQAEALRTVGHVEPLLYVGVRMRLLEGGEIDAAQRLR